MGFSPGLRLPRGPPEPAGPGAPARPAASRPCRRGRWPSPTATPPSIPRRRRAAGTWSGAPASPCSRRRRPPYAVAGAGRPGPLHRGRRGRPRRTRAGGAAAVVPAAGRPRRLRGRGAGTAGRRPGRRAPRRRRGRGPGRRPGRPGVVRRWPTGWRGTRRGRARSSSRGAGPGCAASARATWRWSAARPRSASTAAPAPAGQLLPLGRGPGARGRSPARRLPHLPGGGRRVPRARVVREQRERRADRARRRPARRRGTCCTPARGRHRSGTTSWRAGPPTSTPSSPVELRVVPGPHAEQFDADALARLADGGLRGAARVQPGRDPPAAPSGCDRRCGSGCRRGRLDSQGVVTGAVQVPPDGDPVVLLPDHATLGGYPVLAVVASADHGGSASAHRGPACASCPSRPTTADEARRALRRELARAVVGPYPLAVGLTRPQASERAASPRCPRR